jgi:hypothetical protein
MANLLKTWPSSSRQALKADTVNQTDPLNFQSFQGEGGSSVDAVIHRSRMAVPKHTGNTNTPNILPATYAPANCLPDKETCPFRTAGWFVAIVDKT